MDIAIQDHRDNPLLQREEYELQIDHTGDATPSVSKVRKKFAAENDLDPQKIQVDHIYTRHGGNVSTAFLKAYEDRIVVEEDDGAGEEETDEEPDDVQDEAEEADDGEQEEEPEEADEPDESDEEASGEPEEEEKEEGDA